MPDLDKMREALDHLRRADAAFADGGVYEDENGLACAFSLRDAIEDLDIDIARVESGSLEEA